MGSESNRSAHSPRHNSSLTPFILPLLSASVRPSTGSEGYGGERSVACRADSIVRGPTASRDVGVEPNENGGRSTRRSLPESRYLNEYVTNVYQNRPRGSATAFAQPAACEPLDETSVYGGRSSSRLRMPSLSDRLRKPEDFSAT